MYEREKPTVDKLEGYCQKRRERREYRRDQYAATLKLFLSGNFRFLGMIIGRLTKPLTKAATARTRRVSKRMSRFLFVGRIEEKKLQRARQDRFAMTTEIIETTQFQSKTIPAKLLLTEVRLSAGI